MESESHQPTRNICIGLLCVAAAAVAKSLQSCLTLSDPMDCSPPDSSVHGIFQARVLERGAIAFPDNWIYLHVKDEAEPLSCAIHKN